jgi:two-component system nitrogen regulation response regulator NtrX
MTSILIIDDEAGIRRTLASILEDEKYKVFTAEDALIGIDILERESISLVFLDVRLPNLGGLEALERIRKKWPQVEIVVISGHANVDMAVRAVKLGAFDFLEKPLSLDKVLTVCRNALTVQNLRKENRELKKKSLADEEIVGTSPKIAEIRVLIGQAAASEARILITGDNGTGKELVARAIHRLSSREGNAFVEVNCAAIPDTLIESELFGHEKGAFTDAISSLKWRFEIADGGTLFLDEIGDMYLMAQAKVLRAIQEQKIERVGGEKIIDVDVRIIAATNKNLVKECEEGKFRQDLFFRLNVIPIHIPPLRERQEDIPLLLFHFLKNMEMEKIEFDDSALQILTAHEWPGNVRELRNFAERVAVMHREDRVGDKAVIDLLQKNPASLGNAAAALPGDVNTVPHDGNNALANHIFPIKILEMNYNNAKESFEKFFLEYQLFRNDGIIARTAETLGIYPSNLHAKLRKYRIIVTGGKSAPTKKK